MGRSILSVCLASACAFGHARTVSPTASTEIKQTGIASYYSDKFQGRRTANGERYDKNALTAVHPRLPFGTVIRVTNLHNHRSVELRINDRKHARSRRLLDVSKRAAQELGFVHSGITKVELEVLSWGDS
jgi:rare lipoprotein A